MNWHLIETGFSSGKFNMDYDYKLASECPPDEAFLRFYRWNPFCISLGANQNLSDINLAEARKDGIDVVKRPTGGRAILHAEELTYSAVIPLNDKLTPKEIYSRISYALINGLTIYNTVLSQAELETVQPNFPSLLKEDENIMCFASTAKSEVKFEGKKLIGSAQRKMKNVILQHGSILCGGFHKKLPDYLNLSQLQKEIFKKELLTKTIELESILNQKTDYEKLSECLIAGFENVFEIDFIESKIKI